MADKMPNGKRLGAVPPNIKNMKRNEPALCQNEQNLNKHFTKEEI